MVTIKTTIKDLPFDIIFIDPNVSNNVSLGVSECGITLFTENKIYINKLLCDSLLKRTIIHELTHAFIWAYGLNGVKWDEELICNFMETHSEDIVNEAKNVYSTYINLKKGGKYNGKKI